MRRPSKRDSYRFGRFAEALCRWRLRLSGYRVLHQDYRSATGEIDIIARRGSIVAFIEVKARNARSDAAHALQPKQRRRIERTALGYLARHPELAELDARFDLMTLTPFSWPEHWRAAWLMGE